MGSSKKAILSGVSWTVILNITKGLYGFVSVPLFIGFYGKSHYGLIGLALSINVYLRLLDLGFNSTNVRFYSLWLAKGLDDKVRKLFRTSLGFYGCIGFINALFLVIIALFSKSIFNISQSEAEILSNLIYILAASAFLNWFCSSFNQIIMASEQVGWVQRMSIIPILFQFLVLLFIYLFNLSLETYFFLTSFSMFIILPFSIRKIRSIMNNISFSPFMDKKILKEIVPYSINIFSFSIFQYSMESLRPVFLGMRISADAVAEYKIIGSIVSLAIMVGSSFMGTILPSVSKAAATQDYQSIEKIAYQGTKYISITLSFCAFGLILIAHEILVAYVGEEYLHLYPYLTIWLLLTLFGHNQAISSIILAGDDIRLLSYSSAVATLFGLAVCWFMIPVYGIGGALCGHFTYCIIQFLFYYCYYWREKLKLDTLKIFINSFVKPLIVSAICLTLTWIVTNNLSTLNTNQYVNIIAKGGIFLIFFPLLHYWLTFDNVDKQFIKKTILKN